MIRILKGLFQRVERSSVSEASQRMLSANVSKFLPVTGLNAACLPIDSAIHTSNPGKAFLALFYLELFLPNLMPPPPVFQENHVNRTFFLTFSCSL